MNFVIDNWHLVVVTLVGGFIAGLCFRRLWQAVCALLEFEYRDARCREQADQIKKDYDRVIEMGRDKGTLEQLEHRFIQLARDFEQLRRECGK